MPASSGLIRPAVCSRPVTQPATAPASRPATVASNGDCPPTISTEVTEAPVVKLPSTVRSGKSRTR